MRKARSNYKVCECEYEYMEKFQLSLQNLNNLWSFIEVYAVLVPNLCGEKSVRRKSVWRKITNMRSGKRLAGRIKI